MAQVHRPPALDPLRKLAVLGGQREWQSVQVQEAHLERFEPGAEHVFLYLGKTLAIKTWPRSLKLEDLAGLRMFSKAPQKAIAALNARAGQACPRVRVNANSKGAGSHRRCAPRLPWRGRAAR